MLVTCSACSAKFQLPDEKVAGRKARMKCKNCGEPIVIDGTKVRVSAVSKAPPPPSRQAASAPKHEAPSFNDQTVALRAEDAEALSRQARQPEAPAVPDLDDRITPVSNPLASEHLLDQSYVDAAMDALEQKVFSLPAPRPAAAPVDNKRPKVSPAADDDEATQMMDLPRLLSGAPASTTAGARPASAELDTEEPTRMLDLQPTLGGAGAGGRPGTADADEATRIFDAEPGPRAPRLPPRPSLPGRPAGSTPALSPPAAGPPAASASSAVAPPSPSPGEQLGTPDLPFALSDPTPFDLPPVAPPGPTPAGPQGRGASDLTVQRTRLPSLAQGPARANWGLYLFVLALLATGSLIVVYVWSRPTFDRAIVSTRLALGLAETTQAAGPAFDAGAAAMELARVAALASTCKQPGGPTGAGRARVLFQMSGTASSAAVSPPFHASSSEACLLGLFKSARVPKFGGQAVIVTKTFRID